MTLLSSGTDRSDSEDSGPETLGIPLLDGEQLCVLAVSLITLFPGQVIPTAGQADAVLVSHGR